MSIGNLIMSLKSICFAISISIYLIVLSGCATTEMNERKPQSEKTYDSAELLLKLPEAYNTPDGAAMDEWGNVILSIPNFNNDHLIESGKIKEPSPAVMSKITKDNQISTWYTFKPEDMHPETGRIGPMDAAFGPDGHLYIADMQIFWNGEHKSRLLRINIEKGKAVDMDVVVEGFIVANGVTWKGDTLFVSETILAHTPAVSEGDTKPLLKSGVYGFTLNELQNDIVKLSPYTDHGYDSHLVAQFESSNRLGFGADGVTIDADGHLYTSIVEDGVIYKTYLNKQNKAVKTILFAQDDQMVSADGIVWNPSDSHIYVADFLGNGVHKVDMQGHVITLHKNGDSTGEDGSLDQPCEVIIRGNELIIVNMDMAWAVPQHLQVDTEVDQPYTLSVIQLEE